ncbi:MAG TPA: type II toxin-antitoxin system VapC family toxin [Planctomycetaceae bacterium]
MKYLLDTNAWIALLRQKSPLLLGRLLHHSADDIMLRSVVLAELWYGAWRSGPANHSVNDALIDQLRNRYASLPFDDDAGKEYGRVRAHLSELGQIIGPNDLLIAAIALAYDATLVTHNTSEFNRVPGLLIEDWQIS